MKAKKGFTFVELVIAIAILLVVISGITFSFVQCVLLNESNGNLVTAVGDAQTVLEQIKELAYEDIANYNPGEFTNLQAETITLEYSIGSRISEVTVNVTWSEKQRQRSFQLSTRIAK